jgi:hypothetical protein
MKLINNILYLVLLLVVQLANAVTNDNTEEITSKELITNKLSVSLRGQQQQEQNTLFSQYFFSTVTNAVFTAWNLKTSGDSCSQDGTISPGRVFFTQVQDNYYYIISNSNYLCFPPNANGYGFHIGVWSSTLIESYCKLQIVQVSGYNIRILLNGHIISKVDYYVNNQSFSCLADTFTTFGVDPTCVSYGMDYCKFVLDGGL